MHFRCSRLIGDEVERCRFLLSLTVTDGPSRIRRMTAACMGCRPSRIRWRRTRLRRNRSFQKAVGYAGVGSNRSFRATIGGTRFTFFDEFFAAAVIAFTLPAHRLEERSARNFIGRNSAVGFGLGGISSGSGRARWRRALSLPTLCAPFTL